MSQELIDTLRPGRRDSRRRSQRVGNTMADAAAKIERLRAVMRDARYLVASIDSAYARNTVARIDAALAEGKR